MTSRRVGPVALLLSAAAVVAVLAPLVASGCAAGAGPGSRYAYPEAVALQASLERCEGDREAVRLEALRQREQQTLTPEAYAAIASADKAAYDAIMVGHEWVGRYLSTGATRENLLEAQRRAEQATENLITIAAAFGVRGQR